MTLAMGLKVSSEELGFWRGDGRGSGEKARKFQPF